MPFPISEGGGYMSFAIDLYSSEVNPSIPSGEKKHWCVVKQVEFRLAGLQKSSWSLPTKSRAMCWRLVGWAQHTEEGPDWFWQATTKHVYISSTLDIFCWLNHFTVS
jgi:hypothetical protein